MPARHPPKQQWPTRWLMTDVRMGDALFPAIRRLPRGSGIIFRHDELSAKARLALGRRIAAEARRRGLVLGVARDVGLARRLGADLVHQPLRHPGLMPHSRSVHDEAEAVIAARSRAALCFISPVHPTRSHPGRAALERSLAIKLAKISRGRAIALGGMNETRFERLRGHFHGYAGIDCWIRT